MKTHNSIREFVPCKNPECDKTIEINGWGSGKKMNKRRSGYCGKCQIKKHALEEHVKRLTKKSIPEMKIKRERLQLQLKKEIPYLPYQKRKALTARIKRIENVTIKKFEERVKEKQKLLVKMNV